MSLFGFTSNPTVSINFLNQASRKTKTRKVTGQPTEELLIYSGQESVVGTVEISSPGRKIDHLGIKIEMIGQIGR
jgi:hypothetical protein